MIGTTLSHYRVLERLGAGGFGVVFRARDERLERDVALKVLPELFALDVDRLARFKREAQVLASLNHPNISTIYDLDRAGDTDFIVMELVEGESLDRRIARSPLEAREASAIGAQIADALDALHELGVAHCDLKPGNVMITPRGLVKLLDFGLSRMLLREAASGADSAAETRPSQIAGTLAYLSPEQIRGEQPDPRSDLYALGVLLFEMLAGQRPHAGDTPAALLYEIAHRPAPGVRSLRPDAPAGLEALISRLLEKSPDRRPAPAREVARELRHLLVPAPELLPPGTRSVKLDLIAAASSSGIRESVPAQAAVSNAFSSCSIAVLPLVNLSADPDQEFFVDGMTDAILTHLAAIGGLRLISRTSVMRFKGTNRSIPDIARELSVGCVVEGSVLRSGERVRISIQLIDTVSDTTMWARNYERALGDVIALQTDVARAIAEEIRVRLTPGEVERLGAIADVDPSAYEAYLRGRFLWNRRTRPDVQRALEFFRRAVEMSPRYAQAHAGIADCYNVLGDMDLLSNAEALAAVRAAAGRALELDPRLAEAHTSLGFALTFYAWDWAGAQSAFERAALEGPGYATGHQWYAEFLVSQGRFEEAERESRLALTLDPLSLVIRTSLADVLYFSRRFDEAIAILKATLEVDPAFPAALSDLGRSYAQAGRYDEAIVAFEEARRLGFIGKYSAGLAHSYALAGRTDEARAILAELKRERQERYVSPHAIAVVHIGLGEFEDALQWLERAHEAHDRALIWIKVHPRLDPLRSEPRLTRIIEAMKL